MLVISIEAEDADRALTTIVPHTTSVRGTRFEINLKARFLKEGAFDTQNILSVSHSKFIRKLGTLTEGQMRQINDALKFRLELM